MQTTTERVDAGGTAIVAEVAGRIGDPAVVLLHGTSANGHVWDGVLDALETPVRSVRMDQRGHGRSTDGDAYGAGEFADDVVAVQETLDLGPMVVVGHSLGARNAWVVAAQHPDRVAGVVAVDYVPFVEPEVLDALAERVAAGDRTFADLDAVRSYVRDRYPRMPEDAVERRAVHGYAETDDGLRPLARPRAMQALIEGLRVEHAEELAAVTCPIAMVRGVDSAIVSPEAWARSQRLAPQASWIEVPDADHYVPEEQPRAIATIIEDVLRRAAAHRKDRPWH